MPICISLEVSNDADAGVFPIAGCHDLSANGEMPLEPDGEAKGRPTEKMTGTPIAAHILEALSE